MKTWSEIRTWRRSMRAELLARRRAVPPDEKARRGMSLRNSIWEHFSELRHGCVGFYWPFKGEVDLRRLVRDYLALGAEAALPVVVESRQPLQFWAWRPRMKMRSGIWSIPVPSESKIVQPTALLVPLLGFDRAGYRLGYGGGYYDRTLAAMSPRPLTIGVGYDLGRLESIHPQPHDVPMDAIVTESGFTEFRYRGGSRDRTAKENRMDAKLDEALKCTFPASDPFELSDDDRVTYASPPCYMHEFEPS